MNAIFKVKDITAWFAAMHVNQHKIIECILEKYGYEEINIREIEWVSLENILKKENSGIYKKNVSK